MQPHLSGKYELVLSPYTADKNGWMMYTLVARGAESNAGIDDSLGNRLAYADNVNALSGVIPIQKGVTYTSFANGSGARVDMKVI